MASAGFGAMRLKIRVSAVQFRPLPLARDARFQRRIQTLRIGPDWRELL